MIVMLAVIGVLVSATLVLAVLRILRGPTLIDRMIGSDIVLTTVLIVLAAVEVVHGDLTVVPVLVVIGATSVFATVAVARVITPTSNPDGSEDA
jgi:multicomponent Na+:H+ antiporter subunit F